MTTLPGIEAATKYLGGLTQAWATIIAGLFTLVAGFLVYRSATKTLAHQQKQHLDLMRDAEAERALHQQAAERNRLDAAFLEARRQLASSRPIDRIGAIQEIEVLAYKLDPMSPAKGAKTGPPSYPYVRYSIELLPQALLADEEDYTRRLIAAISGRVAAFISREIEIQVTDIPEDGHFAPITKAFCDNLASANREAFRAFVSAWAKLLAAKSTRQIDPVRVAHARREWGTTRQSGANDASEREALQTQLGIDHDTFRLVLGACPLLPVRNRRAEEDILLTIASTDLFFVEYNLHYARLGSNSTVNSTETILQQVDALADALSRVRATGRAIESALRGRAHATYMYNAELTSLLDGTWSRAAYRSTDLAENKRVGSQWAVNLDGTCLLGADLQSVFCPAVSFVDSILCGCNFSGAHMPFSRFDRSNLTGCRFDFGEFTRASFQWADCSSARFDDAKLIESYFSYAFLADTVMCLTHLQGSHFPGAMLLRTDLTDADLRGANFCSAAFVESDLRMARFDEVPVATFDRIICSIDLAANLRRIGRDPSSFAHVFDADGAECEIE